MLAPSNIDILVKTDGFCPDNCSTLCATCSPSVFVKIDKPYRLLKIRLPETASPWRRFRQANLRPILHLVNVWTIHVKKALNGSLVMATTKREAKNVKTGAEKSPCQSRAQWSLASLHRYVGMCPASIATDGQFWHGLFADSADWFNKDEVRMMMFVDRLRKRLLKELRTL